MPTPEIHAANAVQATGLLAAVTALFLSPITWAGFIGAAFGVAFSHPVTYKEGLLWLLFGGAASLAANAFLVEKLGNFGAGIAFFTALLVTLFREETFSLIRRKIKSLSGDDN